MRQRYISKVKELLFLLPFYIIRYEKSVKKIEEDDAAFQTLIAEYGEIGKKLEKEFLAEGKEREYLVQRILSNRHIDLSDFSYAALLSIAVATATPHSSALHMRKSSCVNIADT